MPVETMKRAGLPSGVFDALSVEVSENDDGYLHNFYQYCNGNVRPTWWWHENEYIASRHISPNAGSSLWGHGMPGLISTGCGTKAYCDLKRCVGLGNASIWQPDFGVFAGQYPQGSLIFLMGCHVGAGSDGADFLFSVAKTLKISVTAGTGLLWCDGNGVWADDGTVWQTATPTNRPTPVNPPSVELRVVQTIQIRRGKKWYRVPVASVTSVVLYGPMITGQAFRGRGVTRFFRTVKLSQPFTTTGVPSAVLTGWLELTFTRGGKEERKLFRVLNNCLLRDSVEDDVYYHIAPEFITAR